MPDQKVNFDLKVISPNIGANSITGNGGITTGTDLVEITLFLFVRIVRARHLLAHYYYGCDPYVEVKVGRFKGTTLCFRNNSDPEWDQVFALEKDLMETTQEVTVEILVKNNLVRSYDDYMGRISIDVSDIPTDTSALAPQWCGLEDQKGRKCRGELMMSSWIGTQSDEAFSEAWHLQLDSVSIGVYNFVNTCSRIYLMPRIWCLRVNLIEVQGLVVEEDAPERSQIFIQATLGNLTLTSKLVKSNNGNPIWNEDLFFAVAEPFDRLLVLSVEQGTLGGHKRLGTCGFPVKNADMRVDGSPSSTKTIDVKQNEGFVGRLSMRLSLDGGYHMFDEDPQYISDLNPTANKLWRPSIGVLEMGILNATGLPAMKPPGRTDAYCVAKYGQKWVRSRTVVNSLSPRWNEQYSWDVYDPCTFVTLSVFDNSQLHEGNIVAGAMDTRIGKVRICLSEMETNKVYFYSYPLVELQPSGLKKMGEIQLALRFSCPDMINLCKVYTLPMLPEQHFADPLSPTQFHQLRKQTIRLVTSKMSKAEPPLRREVVEYMLDSRENVWSTRRFRADFERVNIFVGELVAICTQFDEICKWENSSTTLIICLLLCIVIVYPQHLLPGMFSCLILHVLQQFQKKPRKLSHVDLHLSHVHTASIDELEEEFDPIPSRFGDIIMRNRYDRLRIAAGKYVALMGGFATGVERLQSLLSWQDSIATMLVMVLCLITGIVTLTVPFRALVFVWLLYLLRHPILRSPFPTLYENWVRRMPSKLDSMI